MITEEGVPMFLLTEIGLTVAAWRRGWRWWALLPLGGAVGLAVFLGIAVGASGGSVAQAKPVFLLLDLIGIGTLIGLVARAPRCAQLTTMPKVQVLSDTEVS
jgi:hypothetical protein